MGKKNIPFAIVYDFDGTLAPGNMQEREFIPQIGMTTDDFWHEVTNDSKINQADNILIYMKKMLDKARAADVPVRKTDFEEYGKTINEWDGPNIFP